MRGGLISSRCIHTIVCCIWPETNPGAGQVAAGDTFAGAPWCAWHPHGHWTSRSWWWVSGAASGSRSAGAAQGEGRGLAVCTAGPGSRSEMCQPALPAPLAQGAPRPCCQHLRFVTAPCREGKSHWDTLALLERSPIPRAPTWARLFPQLSKKFFSPWCHGT